MTTTQVSEADLHAAAITEFENVAILAGSQSASLDAVLRLMGSILCQRLDLRRCFVYLRREDGRFSGRIGYRTTAADFDQRVHGLFTGGEDDVYTREIVETLGPVVMTDARTDPRVARRAIRRWGVTDMLGVPLVVEQDVIGIIYLDDDGTEREYSDADITFATVFARLCALAVRQCWMYHRLAERARRLDGQRKGLVEQALVQERVTRAVLDGADLDGVLRVVVELLGKPAVLYSPAMQVMASGSPADGGWTAAPALTPAQAALPWVREELAKLAHGTASVMLRATRESLCRRLLVRLQSDGVCLGYLELCELGRPFRPVDAQALEQAAVGVALRVMAMRRDAENNRQERQDFCTDLIYGRRDRTWLAHYASSFGIDADGRHVVLRAERTDESPGDHRRRDELAEAVTRHLGRLGRTVAHAGVPGGDVLLLDLSTSDDDGAAFEERLTALFPALVERFGIRFVIVSDPVTDIGLLPSRMDKLKEVAALLTEACDEPRIAFARELDLMLLMARSNQGHGAARHARELLAPLLAHDSATGSSLVETLRVFVQCRAQIRSTAAALNVHENTVRYRLNRIRDLSSVDPERFDSLLSVSMAFQAHDLSGGRLFHDERGHRHRVRPPATPPGTGPARRLLAAAG